MQSRRVLVLTYYWPPAGGPGVQRFLKFARYLREFGWEPVIITPRNGSYPYLDESLLQDVPEDLPVIRTGTREPFALYNRLTGKRGKSVPVAMTGFRDSSNPVQRFAKWVRANFFIPDARIGWKPFAVQAALKEIRKGGVQVIITTGPPHSTHLAGLELKQTTGLPWIADFRDPWTTVYYNAFFPRSARTKRRDRALEDRVLQHADHVVVISGGMADEFRDRSRAISVLYNGFDEADLYTGPEEPNDFFRLAYIGNLKPNQQVPALWEALRFLVEREPGFAQAFRLELTGSADPEVLNAIRQAGLEEQLSVRPFVPHQEATRLMSQAGLLLFLIPQSADNKRIITGKIFEYLASKTRMLSIGPTDGEAAEILSKAGREPMLDYSAKEEMVRVLQSGFREWQSNGHFPLRDLSGDFWQYSRRSLTAELAGILDQLNPASAQ